VLAKEKYGIRERHIHELDAHFIPFSAQTRMSGVDLGDGRQIRKGAANAIEEYVNKLGGLFPEDLKASIDSISKSGGTPLVVAEHNHVLGVIQLKDIIKGGINERFAVENYVQMIKFYRQLIINSQS